MERSRNIKIQENDYMIEIPILLFVILLVSCVLLSISVLLLLVKEVI